MRLPPLEKLIQVVGDEQARPEFLRSLTPAAAEKVSRLALLRLQARTHADDAAEIRLILAALQLLQDRTTLPKGEPETSLRLLQSLGVDIGKPSPDTIVDDPQGACQQATAAFYQGHWDEARYLLSLVLASPGIESTLRIRCLRIVASIHHNRGEFEQELGILGHLNREIASTDAMTQSELLMLNGNALTELRKFPEAEAAYLAAIRLTAHLRPRPVQHISNLIVNLTNVRHARMDRSKPKLWQRIRRYYECSYRLLLSCGDSIENVAGLRADRLINMAWTCAKEADAIQDPLARDRLFRRCGLLARLALWYNRRGPSEQPERREAHILGTLNRAYEALGQLDLAEKCHQRAVEMADLEKDRPDIRWDTRWSYSDFCLRNALWHKAYSKARQAHLLAEKERRRRELLEGRTGLSRANMRIYQALVEAEFGMRSIDGARPSVIFKWIEMAKARASLDAVVGGVSHQRYRSSIASPVTFGDFVGNLAPGVCLIEYFELTNRILALVASRDSCSFHFLEGAPRETMEEAASLARSAREQGISSPRLLSLSNRILVPLLAGLREEPSLLLVVPHGALHGIPFHALSIGGSYLIEQMPVVYDPSASIFHRVSRRKRRQDPFLGIAVTSAELSRAREEVESVARGRFGKLCTLVDDSATVDSFLRSAPRAGTIHFACHAEADPGEPTESFVQLGDGPLTVARLLGGSRLRAAQVIINACSSGAEEVDIGEEHVGLVTAFLQAGAASVLGALWQTFDRYSPDFAMRYYTALDRGASRPEALRQAQLSFLTSSQRHLRHPMYWATYFLSGC